MENRDNKGRFVKGSSGFNYKHNNESKLKMSLSKKGKHYSINTEFKKHQNPWNKGLKGVQAKENHPLWGKKHSKKTINKMSKSHKENPSKAWLGKKFSDEHKRKLRESVFEYAKKVNGFIFPKIGRNEIEILNKLEEIYGLKIQRQYKVEGYFLDGYIPELHLAIEIDENNHLNKKQEDELRQRIIESKLKCDFLRIIESDYVNKLKEVKQFEY